MDNQKRGEELNQLSRFLFDSAANDWYWAAIFEILSGIIGVAVTLSIPSTDWLLFLGIISFICLSLAYFLRYKFEDKYDSAETMRRQSVFTEGLGWEVNRTQVSEWRDKVGRGILSRFEIEHRDNNYYASKASSGTRRLLEMTAESAFYTRHLYKRLSNWLEKLLIISAITTVVLLTLVVFPFIPKSLGMRIIIGLYSVIPIILTLDLINWALRLRRIRMAIYEVEKSLEKIGKKRSISEADVLRYVSEYNCQLTQGFPIHELLFRRWHDEIRNLWKRNK